MLSKKYTIILTRTKFRNHAKKYIVLKNIRRIFDHFDNIVFI